MQINHIVLNEIYQRITASGYFSPSDFTAGPVVLTEYPKERFRVTYVHQPNYNCQIVPGSGDVRWSVRCIPGSVEVEESYPAKTKDDLLTIFNGWSRRLEAELRALPIARANERAAEAISALEERLEAITDEAFTREEASKLAQQLQRLQKDFAEQIRKSTKRSQDERILDDRVAQLERDVQFLKDQIYVVTKRHWAAIMAERLRKYLPTLRELGGWAKEAKFLGPALGIPPETVEMLGEVIETTGTVVETIKPDE